MSGPWERYAAAAAEPSEGPWTKYAPVDPVRAEAERQIAAEPSLGTKPLAYSIPIVGPYLDEAGAFVASLPNKVAGIGPTYEQSLERIRARNRRSDEEYPIINPVGQFVGSVVTGGPALSRIPIAKTMPGKIVQGAGIGGAIGAVEGFGAGEGGIDQRIEKSQEMGALGGAIGGALPPAIAGASKVAGVVGDYISPTVARYAQNVRNATGSVEPQPQSAGAAAAPIPPAPPISGAEAAADQVIANRLAQANVSVTDLRQRLAQQRIASELQPGREQPNVTAIGDLDPTLTRLVGTVARQQPEAGNLAQSFYRARQTGETPPNGLPASTGLPTRRPMEPAQPGAPPMGQYERIRSALREVLSIPPNSAYRTEQQMIQAARQEANRLYGDAYQAASGMDVSQHIGPVLQNWLARAQDEPREISRAIQRAARLFEAPSGTVKTLQRFQRSKEYLDGVIEGLMDGPNRNRALGGTLNDMKRELLAAIDNIPNAGSMYSQARGAFSSRAEMRDALELGRSVMRDGAEVSVDQYRALGPGQQQMFRLGIFDAFDRQISPKDRSNNVARFFNSPKTQELLSEIIPRTNMADRPERFGRFVQGENANFSNINKTIGGSPTQERIADDASYDSMMGIIEQLRSSKSITDAAFKLTQAAADKLFGFRADTAAEIARKLLTADRGEVERTLIAIENRLGPSRAAQFAQVMNQIRATVTQSTTSATTAAAVPQQQQQSQSAGQVQRSRPPASSPSQMELPIPPTPQVWPRSPYRDTPPDPKPAPWDKR